MQIYSKFVSSVSVWGADEDSSLVGGVGVSFVGGVSSWVEFSSLELDGVCVSEEVVSDGVEEGEETDEEEAEEDEETEDDEEDEDDEEEVAGLEAGLPDWELEDDEPLPYQPLRSAPLAAI